MLSSEIARRAGVSVQTLRYYERRGLLEEPQRRPSGYREYSVDVVRVVRFVKRTQSLGFSLDEIETLLGLSRGGPDGCSDVRELAAEKISELSQKIDDLSAMRESLSKLTETCEMARGERDCPLVRSIEEML